MHEFIERNESISVLINQRKVFLELLLLFLQVEVVREIHRNSVP